MQEIAPDVFVELRGRGCNTVVIRTADGLVLVDSAMRPSDAVEWRRQVAELGEARYLVHTDHHPDHVIGNWWLPGTVVAHAGTRERLRSFMSPPDWLERFDPEGMALMDGWHVRLPEITFEDRLTLHVGGVTVALIHMPGHTLNTAVVHLPEKGVAIVGDHVCNGGLPGLHDSSIAATFATLDAIEQLDVDVVVPGHGDVGDRSLVDRTRQELRAVVDDVEGAMAVGDTRAEIVERIRFEDNFHGSVDGDAGYPPEMVEEWQRLSIATVYDQLLARAAA
jgi:cyclase